MLITPTTLKHLQSSLEELPTKQIHGCSECDQDWDSWLAVPDGHGVVMDFEAGRWSIPVGCEGFHQGLGYEGDRF